METLEVYIPMDRRQALARGETLPNRTGGAVLVADISGFTLLTDTLAQELGSRRGADELTKHLNLIFEALINEVHRYRGSVITFSGDSITCWFNHDNGLRATACSLAMQQAMLPLAGIKPSSGVTIPLAIKAAVATGPARRFLVGDPQIQYIDVLAGATLNRVDEAENYAKRGEVLLSPEVVAQLGHQVKMREWRTAAGVEGEPAARFAVVTELVDQVGVPPWPVESLGLTEGQARPWLLPPVYERLKAGRERFLDELRPAVALFLSFSGLDYDDDEAAGEKLDAFIRWVQNVLALYEGYLLQLTTGDKGSYLYASFGAPLAHGDDAARAVAAALELRSLPPALNFISDMRLGLSQGRMRAGAYGSAMRRTYGVLGSEVNIAARLMSKAEPGQILISKHVAEAAEKSYHFKYLASVEVKGRQEPIPIFDVLSRHLLTPYQPPTLVGRENALTQLEQLLEPVQNGQGQILRLEGLAGVGKSYLAADFVKLATSRSFQVARAVCQSPEQRASYDPWRQIFREWFDLADQSPPDEDPVAWFGLQMAQVETVIKDINPDWLLLLPLLGDLLGLPIPDNPDTLVFNPLLRRGMFLALAPEMIKTWATNQPSLILIEDAHWLDEASQELTLTLGRTIASTPLLLTLVHRSLGPEDKPLLPDLNQLPYYNHLNLHGKTEPVVLLRPHEQKQPGPLPQTSQLIIGRTMERLRLTGQLQALLQGGSGGLVIIEGEAGIGKSRLVADLLEQAHRLGMTTLVGAGDAIEQSTPYHAWRPVFRQLFNLDARPEASTLARRTHVLTLFPTNPELLRLAPLLNAVLSLSLQENNITRQMTGQVRADNTNELLLHLLQATATGSPTLLVLEDAHWLDSASWVLTRLVSQRVQPLLLVLVTRPLVDPLPAEYNQLLHMSNAQRLWLEALPPAETLTLVCQRLAVNSLPGPVATLIQTKAEGHPFFSEELAYALRDAGLIRISAGVCQLTTDVKDFSAITLPDTIEDVITSRIDRLTSAQQLILKVASVIGRVFAFRLLHDIHPIETDKPHLPSYLDTLERLDITHIETAEPDLTYIFKHIITQEVAYNLMLFAQRQELHQAVAEWYERTYADNLAPFYPLLAHHWSQAAGVRQADPILTAKAIDYLEKAGEQALHNYANQEAISFFSKALSLDDQRLKTKSRELLETAVSGRPSAVALRRAYWKRQLGEAYLALGQFSESRTHLEQTLTLLGWPAPTTRGKLIIALLGQVGRQALHRLWPAWFLGHSRDASAEVQVMAFSEAALAYEHLAEIHLWSQQESDTRLLIANASLHMLNLAERAGPSPELARAYAGMRIAAGFIPWYALAEVYGRQAVETAHQVNQLSALGWVLFLSGIYHLGIGRWTQAEDTLGRAVEIYEQLGDRYRWAQAKVNLAKLAYYRGQFAQGAKLAAEVYAVAHRQDDLLSQAWGLYQQGENTLRLGQIAEAITFLEAALQVYAKSPDRLTKAVTCGLLAVARLRQDQPELALLAAEAGAQVLAQSSLDVFVRFQAYAGIAEVYLQLWESQTQPNLKTKAGQICQAFRKFTRVFPIGRPWFWLCQGLYEWLAGQPGRAHQAWQKSLIEAERLAMPYEQGLAHYEIGRHLVTADPARQMHLNYACDIFAQLEASYDLARAQAIAQQS